MLCPIAGKWDNKLYETNWNIFGRLHQEILGTYNLFTLKIMLSTDSQWRARSWNEQTIRLVHLLQGCIWHCLEKCGLSRFIPRPRQTSCRKGVCRNAFLHGCLDASYRSWDKSKNSGLCENHTFPHRHGFLLYLYIYYPISTHVGPMPGGTGQHCGNIQDWAADGPMVTNTGQYLISGSPMPYVVRAPIFVITRKLGYLCLPITAYSVCPNPSSA